jgi:hypothetical protein
MVAQEEQKSYLPLEVRCKIKPCEAKEQAVRRPGEQWPMKQSRKAETEMQRAKDMHAEQREELLKVLKAR